MEATFLTKVYSNIIQFRGTHREFGHYVGEKIKPTPLIQNRMKQWAPRKDRHFIIDIETYKSIMTQFSPQILQELEGLSLSLNMSEYDIIQFFGGYYLEFSRSGCSVYADDDYLVRNYDSHPHPYEGLYMFYQPSDGGYAHMGPSMQLTGRIDGINEKGLTIAYNFTHRKQAGEGFLCNMIGRLMLETCADVDEAIRLLKKLPHRHSFSYILLDPSGISYVVEATPRQVVARRSRVCTNHFHLLQDENRYRQDESRQREQNILTYQTGQNNAYEAFRVMNDPKYNIFSFKYDAAAGTLHTAVYLPKTLQAWIAIGAKKKPAIFNFNNWLQGKDTPIIKLRGEIEYPKGFANMT